MDRRRLLYGLLALLIGVGFLLAAPGMSGASCVLGAACTADASVTTQVLFVAALGVLSAGVGGWNVAVATR